MHLFLFLHTISKIGSFQRRELASMYHVADDRILIQVDQEDPFQLHFLQSPVKASSWHCICGSGPIVDQPIFSCSSSSWAEVILTSTQLGESLDMRGQWNGWKAGVSRTVSQEWPQGHLLLAISCSVEFLLIPRANEQRSAAVQHWDLTSFMSTGHNHQITHSRICKNLTRWALNYQL